MPICGHTRYQPIVDHLATVAEAEIALTFAEIEALIGGPLPTTTFVNTAYWTSKNFLHVRAWDQLGWRARTDRRNRCIRFIREEGQAIPLGGKTRNVASRYQSLIDFLAEATGEEVTLTYREVMAVIDGPLPESAIRQTYWWTGRRLGHVQAWRALGWRAHASATHLRVVFTRDAEG